MNVSGYMAVLGAAAMLLSACGGGGRGTPSANVTGNGAAPVQLGTNPGASVGAQSSLIGPLDEVKARKAIENYRLSKKRSASPYQLAGVDLNGDGTREAVVLFSGTDWCTNTGCSLAVFQMFQYGFRPISRSVRVKAPVAVTTDVTNGYRDLLVQTGGGPAPERRVRLKFSGSGYSRNAMQEKEVPLGSVVQSEVIFATQPLTGPVSQRSAIRNP